MLHYDSELVSLGERPLPVPSGERLFFFFFFITVQLPGVNVKVPVSLSLFAQPACVDHIHHSLTWCHSVSLLTGNPFCGTSACGPTIRHDKYSEPGPKNTHTETQTQHNMTDIPIVYDWQSPCSSPLYRFLCVCMCVCMNAWAYVWVCVCPPPWPHHLPRACL